MCDSSMKQKIKPLFISLVLSFLVGCLTHNDLSVFQTDGLPFGPFAETAYQLDNIQDLDTYSPSEYSMPPKNNVATPRQPFKPKRINGSSLSKIGLSFIKGKGNYDSYLPILNSESICRFPSGLTEARQYLISLGKLII